APLRVEPVQLDPPGPGEARVRVEACGVCHGDVACAAGAWDSPLPAVYGHEACGIVEQVGADVALAEGERVVVSLIRACGRCARCRAGEPALCGATFALDERSPIGLDGG